MATYDDLRTYFSESETLQRVSRATSEIPIVTGITLSVDPLWSVFYDNEDGDSEPLFHYYRWLEFFEFYALQLGWNWEHMIDHATGVSTYRGFRRRDLNRRVDQWERFVLSWENHTGSKRSPVVMTLVHRPIRSPLVGKEPTEAEDQNALRLLREAVRNEQGQATIRIEERPQAQLSLSVGDAICSGSGQTGTLGGVLEETSTSRPFGVTCAHLAKKGDTISDRSGVAVGSCIEHTPLVPIPVGGPRDPLHYSLPSPYPGNGHGINMLDCALIDLSSAPNRASVGGIAAQLSTGQVVTMNGARTRSQFTLGALAISYTFSSGRLDYCFRDAIELLPRSPVALGGVLGQLTAVCPTQGDSGAWVLTADSNRIWAGMLFGEDTNRGFLVRASWVHDWAQKALNANFTV